MAQQNIFPLGRLNIFVVGPQILKRFYSCIIESILNVASPPGAEGSVYGPEHQASCHPGPIY
jgi:hypothetical protein